jgi:hypothetical protein
LFLQNSACFPHKKAGDRKPRPSIPCPFSFVSSASELLLVVLLVLLLVILLIILLILLLVVLLVLLIILFAHRASPLYLDFSMIFCTHRAENIPAGLAKRQKI